jgi:hypothetical protein
MTEGAMSEEGFLRRWSRRKTEIKLGVEPEPESGPELATMPLDAAPVVAEIHPSPAAVPEPRLPTMDDVARLTPESDFSAFVARGVDQAVRRGALKKLFADPHFNVMDGLDVYIGDFTQPSPVSDDMLASLQHVKSLFARAAEDEQARADAAAAAAASSDTPAEPAPEPAPERAAEQAQPQQPPEAETQ